MGLDGVELVMRLEEEFDIAIPDEDAGDLYTVGNMYDYLLRKLQEAGRVEGSSTAICLSAAAFRWFRRSAMELFGHPSRSLRPSTPLHEIIGSGKALQGNWKRWRGFLGLRFPQLRFPGWVVKALWCACGAVFLGIFCLGAPQFLEVSGPMKAFHWLRQFLMLSGAAGFGAFVTWWVLFSVANWLPLELPREGYTLGDLVTDCVRLNPRSTREWAGRSWTKEEVWDVLCNVIEDQLGISREKIRPEAHFVKDLGVD